MTQPITLALPALAPGQQPPYQCPACGSVSDTRTKWTHVYSCGASYYEPAERGRWEHHVPCPVPRPSAVLRALSASIAEPWPMLGESLEDAANTMCATEYMWT